MPSVFDNPDFWRARAESARVTADTMQNDRASQLMLEISQTCERAAKLAETSPAATNQNR
jgi:hypothetical protein